MMNMILRQIRTVTWNINKAMTTQDLKAVLLAEHKRDMKLMWVGYGVIAGAALLVIALIVWLFVTLNISISGALSGAAGEFTGSNTPTYVKLVLPVAFLLCGGYAVWGYLKLKKRPETIDEFIKHIENGTRVISINESKNYRVKIPLYIINYHTGAVHSFFVALEGVNKAFVLPVPFYCTDEVKDLLNENS
jgi:hypothetical protein